jgi:uncharacterized membrane protein YfcA
MPIAVATSLLVVAMKSFAGFAGYALQFGDGSIVSFNPETQINWNATLIVTAGAIVGALIGSRMVGKIHPDKLRKGFGWFVLVMAAFILTQQIGGAAIEYAEEGTLQLLEVFAGVAIVVAFFTWLIRRPTKVPVVADYDEPEVNTPTEK